MERLTADAPEARSLDVAAANLDKLRALFPEIVTEGREGVAINVDVLKQLVGDRTLTDADEKYGLNWHGKRQARQLALTPSTGTLRPCKDDSVDWDTTQNLFLEGDNLEVLKLLQKSYAGKVKLIYIDPPYNTGNDFVYPDDFRDGVKNYLQITGQMSDGACVATNSDENGSFHTNWLNMMRPRLALASLLLRNDGMLAVSIDGSELSSLLQLLQEVFGVGNVVQTLVWRKRQTQANLTKTVASVHEYVVLAARSSDDFRINRIPYSDEYIASAFANPDHDPRGVYQTRPLAQPSTSSNPQYSVTLPNGREVTAKWSCAPETYAKYISEKRLYIPRDGDGMPRLKVFLHESEGMIPNTWLDAMGTTEHGTAEITQLFEGKTPFTFPKPTKLIQHILSLGSDKDSIILDFFAGSATTGHAVMAQNAADGGTRRYILVQLPEPLDPDKKEQATAAAFCDSLRKPRTIAEISKERLRRAGARVRKDNPLFHGDLGFRVYKLDATNLRAWDPDTKDVQAALFASIDHIKPGRTEADLLAEVLLKLGLDLCVPIETLTISGHEVHAVGGGRLIACLAPSITRASAEGLGLGMAGWLEELLPMSLGKRGEVTALFRDSAFDGDVTKTNLSKILEQYGFTRVRSL